MKTSTFKFSILLAVFGLSSFFYANAQTADSVSNVIGITRTTAFAGCWVTGDPTTILEKGVCYGTNQNPTVDNINDMKVPAYKISTPTYEPCPIIGLQPATTYYIRAYVTDGNNNTTYSPEKQFTTSSNDVEATWSCYSDLTATTEGDITASDFDPEYVTATAQFNKNSGGDGITSVKFPVDDWLKLTSTFVLVDFSADVYNTFSITANSAFQIKGIVLNATGYKTGGFQIRMDYSFDNFVSMDSVLSTYQYNDTTQTVSNDSVMHLTSANPNVTTWMGKEDIVLPANVIVAKGQTITFRMYCWGKDGGSMLMKNLIVSGTTNISSGVNQIEASNKGMILSVANGNLVVRSSANIQKYDIISISGQTMLSATNSSSNLVVNMSSLKSGVYFFKAYTNKGIEVGKFIR